MRKCEKLLLDYSLEGSFCRSERVVRWVPFLENADVYCRGMLSNFVDQLKDDPEAIPEGIIGSIQAEMILSNDLSIRQTKLQKVGLSAY